MGTTMLMKHKENKSSPQPATRFTAWLAATAALCLCQHVDAQQAGPTELPQLTRTSTRTTSVPAHLTVSASVERTDNVSRIPTNKAADTIYGLGTDFRWNTREGGRIDASIDGDLSYYKYAKAEYQPDLVGGARGSLTYAVIPDYFSWQTQDSFRQLRINAVQPITPDNRQNTNLFATGPRLQFPLGNRRTLLIIDGQYEHSSYSVSALDSNVVLGRLAILRRLGANASISVSANGRQVRYSQEAMYPDYKAQDYLFNWTAFSRRTTISLDLGYSYTQQQMHDADSPNFRLTLSRNLTPRTSATLYANHRLTDSSDAVHFGQMGAGTGPRTSDFAANPDPFTLEQIGLTYAFASVSSSIDLDVSMQQDRYQVSTLDDRNITSAELQAWTMLNSVWTAGVFGGYSRENFIGRNDAKSTFTSYGLFAGARIATRMRLELSVLHDSRQTNFSGFDFDENAARLTLSYTLGQHGYSSGIAMPRSNR